MELVLDSTPLIHLTRINAWQYLEEFRLLTTTQAVSELKLDETNYPETKAIQRMIETKRLEVMKAKRCTAPGGGLSEADASVILLAKERGAVAVTDDQAAIALARALEAKTAHSSSLLIHAARKKRVTKAKALRLLDALVASGWHCDIRTYTSVRNAINAAPG